jgi:hypothetical protein
MISSSAVAAENVWLRDDKLLVGGNGRGPFSGGLSNYPIGFANVYGGKSPDLFVSAAKFSIEPGLYLYRWVATDANGAPVFGDRIAVTVPGDTAKVPPTGTIFQARNGTIYGFWLIKGAIVRTKFDREQKSFVTLPLPPLPTENGGGTRDQMNPDNRSAERFVVLENADGSLDVIFSVSDGTKFRPPEPPGSRDPAFHAFDGAGIWKGGWPYVFLRAGHLPSPEANVSVLSDARQVSATQREALMSQGGLAIANFGSGHERDLVTGSHFGNVYTYHNTSGQGVQLEAQVLARGPDSRVIRHPFISASPITYPAPKTGAASDLIVGGEGGLLFYRFTGRTKEGQPQFAAVTPVLMEKTWLYTGSLPVINSVDWDGDGATDLIAGNSEGRILFFKNRGTNAKPAFAPGQPLQSGGEEIVEQTGYWSIQGPGEARFGYASPVVGDWNGDGLPDLLRSDASAHHSVMLNLGTKTAPKLDRARSLYCDGVDIHGSWRVRPGMAKWGKETAYVALDDNDEFHFYWRIDDFNVRDGGKLLLEDGSSIRANFMAAGGTGRSKITLADWDGDGVMDLMVGTPRHGSVPNPKTGLPQSKGLPGSAVLWLRNVGTNEAPRFAFPVSLQVRGQPIYFGQHECSLALTDLGGTAGGPNLLVGEEEGRIYYFRREDISWTK